MHLTSCKLPKMQQLSHGSVQPVHLRQGPYLIGFHLYKSNTYACRKLLGQDSARTGGNSRALPMEHYQCETLRPSIVHWGRRRLLPLRGPYPTPQNFSVWVAEKLLVQTLLCPPQLLVYQRREYDGPAASAEASLNRINAEGRHEGSGLAGHVSAERCRCLCGAQKGVR